MTERSNATELRDRFEAGDALGTWVSIGHPAIVEAAARAGFDFVLIDTEHTEMSLETVAELVRAAAAAPGSLGVVVRPAWNDQVRIKRILDIGVDGLMVPMIDTVDAENIGELLYAMEAATVMYGELAGLSTFTQPAVEWGKKAARGLLGGGDFAEAEAVADKRTFEIE